jgi:hypothetical protein
VSQKETVSSPPRILWDKRRSPTKYVSERLGIRPYWRLRLAIHRIKARSNLGGTDKVKIYEDGRVTDENGYDIGNVYDEA